MKLTDLKGVGPKTEELFNRVGVFTPEDLVHFYPVGYDAYMPPVKIASAREGVKCAVRGRIVREPLLRRTGRVTIIMTEISDGTDTLRLNWFNASFIAKMLRRGAEFVFRGTIAVRRGARVMDHPEIISLEKYAALESTLVPVYSLTKGLSGKTVARAVRSAIDADLSVLNEYLPERLIHVLGLADETDAIVGIHFPDNIQMFERARRRLVFDEFFLFVLAVRALKAKEEETENHFRMKMSWKCEDVIDALPYRLTGAQMRVWREIEAGLSGEKLMSRLVQGDVGSGKTIIAFLAMIMAAENGFQSALMAPTEVLAKQHYDKLCALKEAQQLDFVRPVLLTGSLKSAERREVLKGIADGTYTAVVGTHALFQEGVDYKALSLVITDEQHRFGVKQREALSGKGASPHTLVMSATPIPRTLGVIYYGDLDISIIDERPKRQKRIRNAVVDTSYRAKTIHFLDEQIAAGRQVYVICPMIEDTEEMDLANVTDETTALKKELPGRRIASLHGRMKSEEKERVMEAFLKGETDVLVSTTVVEVGVDVPNATVMLIMNAERFGLAQLHQLRGRVGRGPHESYCILMAGLKTDAAVERLNIVKESEDGFAIAEKDFEMRGPGDLLGIRQSGDAMFRLADVTKDAQILKTAGETAQALMEDDPALVMEDHIMLKRELERYMTANNRNIVL